MPLDPARVDPTPWRNCAGYTRELAVGTDPTGAPGWRISLADLTADAPFSRFPGMDRLFTALGPVRLTIDEEPVELTRCAQVRFAGEAAVAATVERPVQALNVMTRRGAWHASVVLRPPGQGATPVAAPGTGVAVLLGDLVAHVTIAPRTKDDHDRHRPLPPRRDRRHRA